MKIPTRIIEEFKIKVIAEGIASVHKHEKRPERVKGCLAGFELCKTLNTFVDFEDCLAARHKAERDMISMQTFGEKERAAMYHDGMNDMPQGKCTTTVDDYREYRCATAQVEHLFERMKVIWAQLGLYSGPLSSQAVLQAAKILGWRE